MSNVEPPPPPPERGDSAAEGPKGKRPWHKPKIGRIAVNFTADGFNSNPITDEYNDGDGSVGGSGATYRTS